MGICQSSESAWEQESDENIVYVVGEEELGGGGGGGGVGEIRSLASLYSRQGRKGPNQDSAILCQGYGAEDGVFCGVFDGHGKNGHTVSRMVRDYLPSLLLSRWNTATTDAGNQDCLVTSPELSEWKEACIDGFKTMDGELKISPNLDCAYSGTTAVTVIKQGSDLVIANLGDSRAVLGRMTDNGRLMAVQLTTDLKPGLPQEAERIRRCNGHVLALVDEPSKPRMWAPDNSHSGLAMARALGDFHLKDYGLIAVPEIFYRRVAPQDLFVVLATDGVWDVLSNEQVVSIVSAAAAERRSGDAAKLVVEAAGRAWKRIFPSSKADDCSAVCLFLQEMRAGIVDARR